MKSVLLVIAVVLPIALISPAWGHGTSGYIETADGIRIKAEYDDGESMSYAAVEVTAPNSDVVFQKGRTDRNGAFMFSPDLPGKWRVVVSDAMGHRLVLDHEIVAQEGARREQGGTHQEKSPPFSRREGVITGIAVIVGLYGLVFGWKSRRSQSRK